MERGKGLGGGKTGEGGNVVEIAGRVRSNVVVDLDAIDDIMPASLCPLPACPGTAVRRDSSLTAPDNLPSRPAAPPASCPLSRAGDRTNGPDSIANQQKRLKIKTSAETGDKEVGEMTIEALQQQAPAGAVSSDSLDRADPHYFNIKSNFHLSEEDNESNGSMEEFKTMGSKKQTEGHGGRGPAGVGESIGARAETKSTGRGWHTPTYHRVRASRKLQDWRIKVNKPIVFLGDSNLSRIPPFDNDQIQVESYPGANFYHFFNLLETAPVCENTGLVVLSIGLNSVVNGVKIVFPNADIFVAHVHFSKSLSKTQQYNLTIINNFISTHYNYLPCISQHHFHTTADGIHWMRETAEKIFGSWCESLRLSAGLEG